jgi:type III secretory pathway component EscR
MKLFSAALLVAAVAVSGPVMAQDHDQNHDKDMHDKHAAPVRHAVSHHKETYRRTIKNDQDEHQATEDLNRQYRGVPRSDAH